MSPLRVSYYAWGAWLISWLLAASWSARVANRPVFTSQSLYHLITIVGAILLFADAGGRQSLIGPLGWSMVAFVVAGFAFCWWARVHLGAMWSSTVTRKDGHHIVDTGPYGLVRHPIYAGLIFSTIGHAVLLNELRGYAGVVFIALGFYVKAKLEERFLRQEPGPEAYDGYRARVPMLIPWKLGFAGR
jgi:protein-S-isoprenylcysteine O-methyltransferase Ste14